MNEFTRLRILEGISYVCAVAIGLALITESRELRFLATVSGIIVIIAMIRLLVMGVSLLVSKQVRQDPSEAGPKPREEGSSSDSVVK